MLTPTIPVAIGSTATNTSATSLTLVVASAVPAGSFVVAGAGIGVSQATVGSVTDTRGNTWQVDTFVKTGGNRSTAQFSSKITTAIQIGDTIGINWSATNTGNNRRLWAYQTTNLDPTTWKHAASSTNGTSTTPSSGNIVTSAQTCIIFAYGQYNGAGGPYAQGAGYTVIDNIQSNAQNWIATMYKIVTPGTYVANGSITSAAWDQNGVAYVGAPSPSGGMLPMMGVG